VAVEVRHVVGQRVEVERPPRRRHLLNRSDVRRRSQPGWFFAFAAPAGEARGTDQSEAEGKVPKAEKSQSKKRRRRRRQWLYLSILARVCGWRCRYRS
jgi:hypothetical protein